MYVDHVLKQHGFLMRSLSVIGASTNYFLGIFLPGCHESTKDEQFLLTEELSKQTLLALPPFQSEQLLRTIQPIASHRAGWRPVQRPETRDKH